MRTECPRPSEAQAPCDVSSLPVLGDTLQRVEAAGVLEPADGGSGCPF